VTGAGRVAEAFARAKREGRGAVMPFVTAGDPSLEATLAVVRALAATGAAAIEIGIPYGDPLADGPAVAAAAHRALQRGTTIGGVLGVVHAAAADPAMPPLIAFTYANPIVQFGLDRFAAAFEAAGGSAAIVPDLPIEEAGPIRAALAARGIPLAQLVAPTTPLERAIRVAAASDGFVYLVSRLGVTGAAREPDIAWIAERMAALRPQTTLPIAVGFGIATAAHVRAVVAHADGAIVGSALVSAIAEASSPADAAARARAYLAPLVAAAAHP